MPHIVIFIIWVILGSTGVVSGMLGIGAVVGFGQSGHWPTLGIAAVFAGKRSVGFPESYQPW